MCLDCGRLTSPGPRCPEHERLYRRRRWGNKPINPLYRTPRWRALSASILAEHRRTNGDWCPGYQREAHMTSDLTVDHIVAMRNGGAPYDRTNLTVLCRSCNGRKAGRT